MGRTCEFCLTHARQAAEYISNRTIPSRPASSLIVHRHIGRIAGKGGLR
jgi:hypothetical protein